MNIYLVRHADSLSLGEQGVTVDEDRPLSDRGRQQCAQLARALKQLGAPLDRIVTSPLKRSLQTAEELFHHLEMPQLQRETCDQLAPGHTPKKLAKYLLRVEGENLMLVGHEPDLSRHTGWLIGSKDAHLEYAKGAIACVSCDAIPHKGAGTLLWLVTPQWFTALSASG